MTNQEAAEMIRNDMKLHHDYLSGQYRKALNMAINALLKEQPDIVWCKDCVHWIPGIITDKDDFIQPRCKRNGGGWSSDDYCSCAEKRTDEI